VNRHADSGGTTTVTSTVFSVPSTITPDEQERLSMFFMQHGRWPQPGDGASYELLLLVEGKADRALASAPRQRGESASGFQWRRTTASLRLKRTRSVPRVVLPRARGRAQRGRRVTLRRSPARSPGRPADDPDDLADPETVA